MTRRARAWRRKERARGEPGQVQGNNPDLLHKDPEKGGDEAAIEAAVREMIGAFGRRSTSRTSVGPDGVGVPGKGGVPGGHHPQGIRGDDRRREVVASWVVK